MKNFRIPFFVIIDIFLCSLSFYLAFYLRFDGKIPYDQKSLLINMMPNIIGIRLLSFAFWGIYNEIWKYATIKNIVDIFKAVISSSSVFIIFILFVHGHIGFPRSIYIIDALLIFTLTGCSRFIMRIFKESFISKKKLTESNIKNVLIVGAGDAGNMLLREITATPQLKYNVTGFIDDDKYKQKMNIGGCPVLGTRKDIQHTVITKKIHEIIIAIASASRNEINLIISECQKTHAKIKIIPSLSNLIDGKIHLNQIREIQIEDLLGRKAIKMNNDDIHGYLTGKTVLVTGAGGSIGSEICRQLMNFNIKTLLLLGRGEYSIYTIYNELKHINHNNINLIQIIGNIVSKNKMHSIFKKYKPEIIFHAGADKHVPLMEINPDEAVLNNIIGTKNIIDAAEESLAEKVICISTDKAANPSSVMGCSKRAIEIYIQSKKNPITSIIGVRFGNVLGSRGSVIPLFKNQIKKGGPVTVTHPEMTRYFMTIPEAAQLVMQAGAIGKCGSMFLLDMGEPVKIIDLAKQMIKLSGFEPDTDIGLKVTGCRPGEKLEETLIGENEELCKTSHQSIFEIKSKSALPQYQEEDFDELYKMAAISDEINILKKLKKMVPTYMKHFDLISDNETAENSKTNLT